MLSRCPSMSASRRPRDGGIFSSTPYRHFLGLTMNANDNSSAAEPGRISLDTTLHGTDIGGIHNDAVGDDFDSMNGSEIVVPTIPRLNNAEDLRRGFVKTHKSKTKEYTILLVGETGTGKTSLISLFANILAGRDIDEFDIVHDLDNESRGKKNESQTKSALLYEFKSKNGVKVSILDTPGLVDTRGIAQDDSHKQSIANTIEEEVEMVTAVLLLTNGTVERLGVATHYALSTLSSLFPRTLADNMGVMFTCVSSQASWNFEPESLPEVLRGKIQFLVNNPLAKWKNINAIRGQNGTDRHGWDRLKRKVEECHNDALEELALLFDWLDTLTPQPTKDIANLYERYQQIGINIANALSRASQIADKKAELTRIQNSTERNKITMKEYCRVVTKEVWEQVNRPKHSTICRHPECHSNCCVGCKLPLFFLDPDTVMQECFAMTDSGCRRCGHSLMEHYYYPSIWKKRNEAQEVIVEGSEQQYENAKQKNDEYENMTLDLGKKIADIDREYEDLLVSLERLTESYAALSLTGSFIGQVKKTKMFLETNLEMMRQVKDTDPRIIDILEKSLDDTNKKLTILQEVDKGEERSRRRPAGGKAKRIGGIIKGGVKSAVRGAVSGLQAFSTALKTNSKSRPVAGPETEDGL